MKKAISGLTALSFLTLAQTALAQVDVQINPPKQGVNPTTPVGIILQNVLVIIFVIAALAVLFMLIWGAFQWITSGGVKESVDAARKRITQALVGLFILALAFLITRVVGSLVGIDITALQTLPRLDQPCPPDQVYDPTATTANKCVAKPADNPRQ